MLAASEDTEATVTALASVPPASAVAVVSVLANSTPEEQTVVVGALNTLAEEPDPTAATAVADAMLNAAEVNLNSMPPEIHKGFGISFTENSFHWMSSDDNQC